MESYKVKNDSYCEQLYSNKCDPFTLLIGVICGSTVQIRPLLDDIYNLKRLSYLKSIEVFILANGETPTDVIALASEIFGGINTPTFRVIGDGLDDNILPIGQARSKLQKVIGYRMECITSSYAWILDDDMRIPNVADKYLTWLPEFKSKGIDVLIGNFDGGSPNPPAHGIRVQLNDLIHNFNWLDELHDNSELPDRSLENKFFRLEYPDYYYDLSRKHKKHLDMPYWVIPEFEGETVKHARQRIIENVDKILTGEPFLRPLITSVSTNPIADSKPSCNRGGNTFILTPEALTLTPNTTLLTNGEENRRSDMIWAIINRYYHNLKIHAVSFPVYHHRYINVSTHYNLDKTVGEIRGAALYAAMFTFFEEQPHSDWNFSEDNSGIISDLYLSYIQSRLNIYKQNFESINKLLDKLESELASNNNSTVPFLCAIREWVSTENFDEIEKAVFISNETVDLEGYLHTLVDQIRSFK